MPIKQSICVLQHVFFEGPAAIDKWAHDRGHFLFVIKLYLGEALPSQNDFDWLIIMGGPMGVSDIEQYPWLMQERHFILETIELGKPMLGICLGAQIIATALGAVVKKNKQREIGWFKIRRKQHVAKTILSDIWPESIDAFHWHGDTFDIPKNATLIASSDACANQGFILDNRIIGLQFHLEITLESVTSLIQNCRNELDESEYVQSIDNLVTSDRLFIEANKLLYRVLEKLACNSV